MSKLQPQSLKISNATVNTDFFLIYPKLISIVPCLQRSEVVQKQTRVDQWYVLLPILTCDPPLGCLEHENHAIFSEHNTALFSPFVNTEPDDGVTLNDINL